jgi:hypothetical protein
VAAETETEAEHPDLSTVTEAEHPDLSTVTEAEQRECRCSLLDRVGIQAVYCASQRLRRLRVCQSRLPVQQYFGVRARTY